MLVMRTVLVAVSIVLLAGCTVKFAPGPVEHFEKSIDLDKSEMSRIEVKMGAGELRITGGSSKFMDADFEYDIPSWKPSVHYNASSFRSELLIEQPGNSNATNNIYYKWNLRFNDKLPIDLVTHLGAGEAHFDIGAMTLRSLEIHMGVGHVDLDLRGNPTRDYNVELHGGIGQATVHLPSSVGIDAKVNGGIGDIEAHNLEKRDGRWVNAAREHSPVTIHLDIKGGIGNITLSLD
jgi:hypothetical protein